jgi:hypothetical protein
MSQSVACSLGNVTVIHVRWFYTSFYWIFHLKEIRLFTLQIYEYNTKTRDLSSDSVSLSWCSLIVTVSWLFSSELSQILAVPLRQSFTDWVENTSKTSIPSTSIKQPLAYSLPRKIYCYGFHFRGNGLLFTRCHVNTFTYLSRCLAMDVRCDLDIQAFRKHAIMLLLK